MTEAAACRGLLLVDPSPSSALPIDIEDFVDGAWSEEARPHASASAAAEVAVYAAATEAVVRGNHWIHLCNPGTVTAAIDAWLRNVVD